MPIEFDNSRIERTKRGLYGTDQQTGVSPNAELSPSDIEVANDWGDTEILTERRSEKHVMGMRILKYVISFAILTVSLSVAYLLYQFLDPFSKPSDKNIQITFDVPVGVSPGVPADVLVRITNLNRAGIEYANLTLLYPLGTKNAIDPTKDLHDEKKALGVIGARQSIEFHTRAIFLGEENTDKELRASLEYRFDNINSVFTKVEKRQVHILTSPINLTVDALKQVSAGQEIELGLNIASNAVIPLYNVLVKIEYPTGFSFTDASPKPTFGNNIWRIGRVDPAEKFAVKVRGVLSGEDTQGKVFHTSIGVGSDQTEREMSIIYSKVLSSMMIERPFIGINLMLGDRSADQAVSHFGESISGTVLWVNNLPTRVTDAQIEVRLAGVALDRSSVKGGEAGFFRSSDDTIFWDQRGDKNLADIDTGGSGSETFSFSTLPSVSGNQLLTNSVITAEVTVRGKHLSERGIPEEIKTIMKQNVKISSQTQFASWATYYTGPFVNTGPIPPRVEQETSYTIWWSIRNTSNMITDTEARAVLPSYVRWAGSVSPSSENITYNPTTHQIIWKPGDIPVGTGVGKPPREVAFQIILSPSLSQVSSPPEILKSIQFSGVDSFTGEDVSQEKAAVNTVLSKDPRAPNSSGNVLP